MCVFSFTDRFVRFYCNKKNHKSISESALLINNSLKFPREIGKLCARCWLLWYGDWNWNQYNGARVSDSLFFYIIFFESEKKYNTVLIIIAFYVRQQTTWSGSLIDVNVTFIRWTHEYADEDEIYIDCVIDTHRTYSKVLEVISHTLTRRQRSVLNFLITKNIVLKRLRLIESFFF